MKCLLVPVRRCQWSRLGRSQQPPHDRAQSWARCYNHSRRRQPFGRPRSSSRTPPVQDPAGPRGCWRPRRTGGLVGTPAVAGIRLGRDTRSLTVPLACWMRLARPVVHSGVHTHTFTVSTRYFGVNCVHLPLCTIGTVPNGCGTYFMMFVRLESLPQHHAGLTLPPFSPLISTIGRFAVIGVMCDCEN